MPTFKGEKTMRNFQVTDVAPTTAPLTGRDKELADMQAKADQENGKRVNAEGKKNKGTRIRVGQTRGKNPKVISWEAFDTDYPETLPAKITEFVELTGTKDEPSLVAFLIDGFNANQYAAASDVLAEFVEPNWPELLVKQFKLTVSNYVAATGSTIEDAVALMKPGIVKAFNARLAAAS